jgi:hypothetical protein
LRREGYTQRVSNLSRDFILHCKNILHFSVEAIRSGCDSQLQRAMDVAKTL